MKKILLAFILMVLSLPVFSQDYSYLLTLSKTEAVGFADKINSEVRVPWKFVEAEDSRDYLRVQYVPQTTTDEELKRIKDRGLNISGVKYYTVTFKKYQYGEDKELELEGETKYKFQNVNLPYMDAFKVWEKLFFPGTTVERTRAREDCEIPLVKDSRLKLKFSPAVSPAWKIYLLE